MAAVDLLRIPLQQSLACLTRAVLIQGRPHPDQPQALVLTPRFVPLTGDHRFELSVRHQFEPYMLDGDALRWGVRSVGYWYHIRRIAGPEVIAFHWHPRVGQDQIPFPHLHLQSAVEPKTIGADKHIPSGRVSLEAVVRFLITELSVPPVRRDWDAVLTRNEAEFHRRRTW